MIGFSAGGHLAGLAALAEEPDPEARADFAILGYAITSMERNVYPTAGQILLGPRSRRRRRGSCSLPGGSSMIIKLWAAGDTADQHDCAFQNSIFDDC